MTVTDFRGVPITPGCVIVYPGRRSSTIWMNEAKVLEVFPSGALRCELLQTRGRRPYRPGTRVDITQLNRVAVVEDQ